jgi:hypothetical protein
VVQKPIGLDLENYGAAVARVAPVGVGDVASMVVGLGCSPPYSIRPEAMLAAYRVRGIPQNGRVESILYVPLIALSERRP